MGSQNSNSIKRETPYVKPYAALCHSYPWLHRSLSETESEHLLLLIKLGSPVLDLCTNNLFTFSLGYKKCLPGDYVIIYDLIYMVSFFYCIFVSDCRNFIINPIFNSISKNKVDWFKVEVFFLFLYTDWYHMTFVIGRSVIVLLDITCK